MACVCATESGGLWLTVDCAHAPGLAALYKSHDALHGGVQLSLLSTLPLGLSKPEARPHAWQTWQRSGAAHSNNPGKSACTVEPLPALGDLAQLQCNVVAVVIVEC